MTMILRLEEHQNHREGLLKHRWVGSTSRVPDSIGPGWGIRI